MKLTYINSTGLKKQLHLLRYILFMNSYDIYASFGFMIFINLTIIVSLFLDYLRQAIFGAYIDPYVDAILIVIIAIFVLEIVIYMI